MAEDMIEVITEDMPEMGAPKNALKKPSAFLYVAAGSALLGAVAMGTVLGWSSTVIHNMKDNKYEITSNSNLEADMKQTEDWISATTILGGLVGALTSGPLAQILGRKLALIISGVPMILGFGCLCLAPNLALVIIGRVLTGFSAGLISGTAPTYVVEISTENVRGMLGIGFQLCVTIGILFVYIFGSLMSWKLLSMICILFPVAMLTLMLFMPETPIWLMTESGGDFSKGSAVEKALKKLRDESNDNESELKEMAESTAQTQNFNGFSLKDIKNPLFYKPLIISILLMFFQQISGIFNNFPTKSDPIFIVLVQLIPTLVCALLVDHLGRKILLIGSGVGLAVSLVLLCIHFVTLKTNMGALWLAMLCQYIFSISFFFGWAPIPWLMMAEITPIKFRSLVVSMATGVNWGISFFITFYLKWPQTPRILLLILFLLGLLYVVSIQFVLLFLPETKDKQSVEIIKYFTGNVPKSECSPSDLIEINVLNDRN